MSDETKPPVLNLFERITPRQASAAMAMHKMLSVTKDKNGARKVECDILACWELADAMVAAENMKRGK